MKFSCGVELAVERNLRGEYRLLISDGATELDEGYPEFEARTRFMSKPALREVIAQIHGTSGCLTAATKAEFRRCLARIRGV